MVKPMLPRDFPQWMIPEDQEFLERLNAEKYREEESKKAGKHPSESNAKVLTWRDKEPML